MIKTLFNDNNEPVDCNFDKLQLMYEENNGCNTIINHYTFNEDIEDASDHFQKTIRINDKNIDIDCEIAGLIDRLNNKLNAFMQKKGLNNTNISESDIEEFAINVLRSTNRSAFYNHLQLLNNILESKNINYQVKEEKLVDKCVVFDESKYFTKSQILDICDLLLNACDKFIIYAMFYGILGKEYNDLRNIKIKDIARETRAYY